MGLDFNYSDAHWAYSGFNGFRAKLAKHIGIDWEKLFDTKDFSPLLNCKDPIIPLLNHSDCDGSMTPSVCGKVAKRLREIVKTWDDSIDNVYDKEQALKLAKGMDWCCRNKKRLIFK